MRTGRVTQTIWNRAVKKHIQKGSGIQQEKPRGKKAVLNWYLTIRILSGAALQ